MRPEIKTLNSLHKQEVTKLEKITAELTTVDSKIVDLDKMEAAIMPALAVTTGDIDAILAQRMEANQIQQRREIISELRSDLVKQADVLKLQQREQKLAVNQVAGMAWSALAESLLAENADLLRSIGQISEKAGYPLQRYFQELPYLSINEAAEIEKREGFPQWL